MTERKLLSCSLSRVSWNTVSKHSYGGATDLRRAQRRTVKQQFLISSTGPSLLPLGSYFPPTRCQHPQPLPHPSSPLLPLATPSHITWPLTLIRKPSCQKNWLQLRCWWWKEFHVLILPDKTVPQVSGTEPPLLLFLTQPSALHSLYSEIKQVPVSVSFWRSEVTNLRRQRGRRVRG